MAFGSGFAKTRTVPIGQKRHGVNRAKTHIDVMIGTDDLNADGIRQNGKRVPLVTDGNLADLGQKSRSLRRPGGSHLLRPSPNRLLTRRCYS